jgi:hypothetical protein
LLSWNIPVGHQQIKLREYSSSLSLPGNLTQSKKEAPNAQIFLTI